MKRRQGFVSNSSASSFIVIRKDFMDKKIFLSKQDEKIIRKFGFKKVSCYYADQVDYDFLCQERGEKISKQYQYGYSVVCNQDDVIYFLLKNNISFEGICEYDHYHVFYQKNAKYFLRIQNYGQQASMSNWRDDKNYSNLFKKGFNCKTDWRSEKIQKINVKKYLKEQKKWQEEFQKEIASDNKELQTFIQNAQK